MSLVQTLKQKKMTLTSPVYKVCEKKSTNSMFKKGWKTSTKLQLFYNVMFVMRKLVNATLLSVQEFLKY